MSEKKELEQTEKYRNLVGHRSKETVVTKLNCCGRYTTFRGNCIRIDKKMDTEKTEEEVVQKKVGDVIEELMLPEDNRRLPI